LQAAQIHRQHFPPSQRQSGVVGPSLDGARRLVTHQTMDEKEALASQEGQD